MDLDGYVRVSTTRCRAGESFIAPTPQREQIEGRARMHGHRLQTMLEELDESGARADGPLVLQALERIESGASDRLVVARLDRFGRSLT